MPGNFEEGQLLNHRYRLDRSIGVGGMGEVWLAADLHSDEQVALKTLFSSVEETDRRRFEREIRTLQNLNHPNIVSFRDLGWVGDQLYFTMDYIEGTSLEEVLKKKGAFESAEEFAWLIRLLISITSALGHLHTQRLVHRDVKPSNILLSCDGSTPGTLEEWLKEESVCPHLADFGLVKGSDTEAHLTQSVLGTPQYMSPEQIEASSAVDARSDLYSIGVILYRAATGRLPFERLSDVLAKRGTPEMRELNRFVTAEYEDVVSRFLEFEAHRRPADAEEANELLGSLIAQVTEGSGEVHPRRRPQPTFSGRTVEIEQLLGAARRAARGEGRWVSLTGERGLGKTWLVTRSDLRTRALVSEQLAFFSGTFTEGSPHGGYAGLLDGVLRHLERHHGASRVHEALGRWGRQLVDVFPKLSEEKWHEACPEIEEEIPVEILKERLIETVVGILTNGAEVEPRILFLEDLHHCDEFDLELLRRVLLTSLELPILVVTTHRQSLEGQRPALGRLIKEIRIEDRLDAIELAPFDSPAAATMVRSLLTPDRPVSDALIDLIMERTDGVPLYLLHLFNSLWAKELIALDGAEWCAGQEAEDLPIPESTRTHFLLALDEVPAPERKVLNLGAVIGRRFSFELLLLVTEADEFDLDQWCRNLVHSGILEESQDGFRFQHGFEREIILDQLSGPMRRRLHARVAQHLEALYANDTESYLDEIAEQMYLGGNRDRALDYLRRAGAKAEAAYALRRALDFFNKALEISSSDRDRRSVLTRIGDVHLRLGEPSEALRQFREAIFHFTQIEDRLLADRTTASEQDREDLASYADLLLKFGEVYVRTRDHEQALTHFEKAERVFRFIDHRQGLILALGRQGAAHAYREELDAAESAYRQAVEIDIGNEPTRGVVVALGGLAYVDRMRGRLEEALVHTTGALEIAELIGDRTQSANVHIQFGTLYRSLGRLSEAVRSYETSLSISEPIGDRRAMSVALMNLGRTASLMGDFRRSLDSLTRARELFQTIGDPQGAILTLGNLGTLHFYLGEFNIARRYLEEYRELAERRGFRRALADADHCLGVLEHELDHLTAARERFEASLKEFERAGDEEGVLHNRVELARVAGREGKPEEALDKARSAGARAEEIKAAEPRAHSLRVEAEARREMDDLKVAQKCAENALEMFEAQAQPYAVSVCHRTLAKIYRDRGFEWADRAGRHFERALSGFDRIGARHALAITRREYGSFLLLVEEVEEASSLFQEAAAVFEELGSQGELVRVNGALASLGLDPGGQ